MQGQRCPCFKRSTAHRFAQSADEDGITEAYNAKVRNVLKSRVGRVGLKIGCPKP